jgi:hypothetical protein
LDGPAFAVVRPALTAPALTTAAFAGAVKEIAAITATAASIVRVIRTLLLNRKIKFRTPEMFPQNVAVS